ncbi:MAG TPA: aminopeptidase [Candidatus Polarisedimenticolaceae bacterium]|nr:aminopeptidase [Candidatus Polarisedimenticolaceae bacterium]
MSYTPPQKVLENYADVLVNFALNGGEGLKKGEVVYVMGQEVTKPLYTEVCKAVWRSGGHVIDGFFPNEAGRYGELNDMYDVASDEQLDFFPTKFYKGLSDAIDHQLMILSDTDLHALEKVDPQKILRRRKARHPFMQWRDEKENAGKFTWTLGLYGTEAAAKEALMTEEEYWEQIINACFLNEADPVARWRETEAKIKEYVAKLDNLPIEKLHVEGKDVDLWIKLGEKRRWMGGSGRNVPSFEVFTSPDWRGTEGWIRFNQPLYSYGSMIENIRLEFKDGKVVKATADTNEPVLKQMIATEHADKVGEFSMTDQRLSRITKFMANTLYDENIGGPFGNTHIAVGKSYQDCYDGDPAPVSKEEWERLGFNDSSVHTDMITTADRTVTATLTDGSEKVIYKNGQFRL